MTDPKKYNAEVCPPKQEKGIVDSTDGRNCTVCGNELQKGEYCEQERQGNPANG